MNRNITFFAMAGFLFSITTQAACVLFSALENAQGSVVITNEYSCGGGNTLKIKSDMVGAGEFARLVSIGIEKVQRDERVRLVNCSNSSHLSPLTGTAGLFSICAFE